MTKVLNHARCLLMNVDGSGVLPEYPGEEIVDPTFRAADLPTAVDKVRAVLFGVEPDRAMLNYRTRELLAAAHATPLEPYLLTFDSRITYDFRDPTLVYGTTWGPTVETVFSPGAMSVYGEPDPPDATGRVRHVLDVTTPEAGSVQIERQTRPFSKVVLSAEANEVLALSGTGLSFRLTHMDADQHFRVTVLSRPTRSLASIVDAVAGLGEPVQLAVFGFTRDEPFATFRELWKRKRELPLRVAALVCALVHRIEEARTA